MNLPLLWVRDGDQKLAAAVILQALEDAIDPQARLGTRREALEFLEGRGCTEWCQVAGLDPDRLRTIACRTARFLAQAG